MGELRASGERIPYVTANPWAFSVRESLRDSVALKGVPLLSFVASVWPGIPASSASRDTFTRSESS